MSLPDLGERLCRCIARLEIGPAGHAVIANAHFNKSSAADIMALIMGSSAFGNVARAALGFAVDTEAEDGSCVISQAKNNLGRMDLPSLRYRIDAAIIDTDEGPATVGKLVMLGESDRSVTDILRDSRGNREDRDGQRDIDEWLTTLLSNGPMKANDIYSAADAAGYSKDQAKGAKKRLGVLATHPEIPGPWFWEIPQGSSGMMYANAPAPTPASEARDSERLGNA